MSPSMESGFGNIGATNKALDGIELSADLRTFEHDALKTYGEMRKVARDADEAMPESTFQMENFVVGASRAAEAALRAAEKMRQEAM